jgi:hypothetical protein
VKLLALLALAALSAIAPAPAASKEADLDLVEFFMGRTRTENIVKIAFRKPVRQVIDSVGHRAPNGDLIIVDTIREEGKPVETRKWVMRADGPNRFIGSMADAVTPVRATISGRTAIMRYKVKGGISIEQKMTLVDSRTAINHASAKKLGIRLGRLDGKIRKLD